MPFPSEEAVVLVGAGAIFQPVFLAQGEHIEVIDVQDAPQIGVAAENDAEKVVFLPFHPVGCWPKGGSCRYGGVFFWEESFDPDACVLLPVMEVVNNAELLAAIFGVMNGAQRGQKVELQLFVVAQQLKEADQLFAGCVEVGDAVVRSFS